MGMPSLQDRTSPSMMLQILSSDRLDLDEVDVLDFSISYCCRKAGSSFTGDTYLRRSHCQSDLPQM